MEWVRVHVKSSKIQPDRRISHPISVPKLGNKFSVLAGILEAEVERPQIQETESAQNQIKSNQAREQVRGASHIQTSNGELKTTTQQFPKFQSGISVAAQNRITSQIIRKSAAANSAHRNLEIYQTSSSSTTTIAKVDDVRKKKEKLQAGRAGNEDQWDDFPNIYLQ